jgi:hypothetical protein
MRDAAAVLVADSSMVGRRDFPGRRWTSIALRALHLAGVVLCAAGILGAGRPAPPGIALMLLTGLALYGLDWWHHPPLWREVAGVFVAVKLVLLGVMILVPPLASALFWLLLLASAIVSHAPRTIRHRSILG